MTAIQNRTSTLTLLFSLLWVLTLSAQDSEPLVVDWELELGKVVNLEVLPDDRLLYHTKNKMGVVDLESGSEIWKVEGIEAKLSGMVTTRHDFSMVHLVSRNSLRSYAANDGRLLWDTSEMGFKSYGGHVDVDHSDGLILLLGKNADGKESVTLLDSSDGSIKWTRDDVFKKEIQTNCITKKEGLAGVCPHNDSGLRSLHGLQKPFVDRIGNLTLFLNQDGVLSLDLETGDRVFRNQLVEYSEGLAQIVSDEKFVYIPDGKKVMALSIDQGKIAWKTNEQASNPEDIIPVDGGILVRGEKFIRSFNLRGELAKEFDDLAKFPYTSFEDGIELVEERDAAFNLLKIDSLDGPPVKKFSIDNQDDLDLVDYEIREDVKLLFTKKELLFADQENEVFERIPFESMEENVGLSILKIIASSGALAYKGAYVGYGGSQDDLVIYDSENYFFRKVKKKVFEQIDKDTGEVTELNFSDGSFDIISSSDIVLTLRKNKTLRRMRLTD